MNSILLSGAAAPLLAAFLLQAPGAPPEREDANLRALHLAGANAWACGDRGAVWHSADAGFSWTYQPTRTTHSLRGLSFLTNRLGWAAGGGTAAFTADSEGVVLKTTDGGATWNRVDRTPLPAVAAVRFFTPHDGLAACAPTAAAPSGLWATADGGATWDPRPGTRLGHWRAAALAGPDRAVLVGERGRVALLTGGEPKASPAAPGGLAALTAVTVAGTHGWACGEGGGLWRTDSAGRAWKPAPLPDGVTPHDCDLRGVWADKNSVAVCGEPGGVVFAAAVAPDGTPTWTAGFTGQTAPLNAVAFSESGGRPYGLAVGDLGAVVRTAAGPTAAAAAGWTPVRGGGRRAAGLVLTADPAGVPFLALARHAADDGHRVAALCPVRRDLGTAADQPAGAADRFDQAVLAAGGSAAGLGWNLPLAVPGLETNAAALAADWTARGDGRGYAAPLARRLARAIRTWRPSVVILDAADAAADPTAPALLIRRAAEEGLELAADPTRLTDLDRLGLRPWTVARVLERRPGDEPGAAAVRATDDLRRLGGTAGDLAAPARSRIQSEPGPGAEAFAVVRSTVAAKGVFGGVNLAPGGPARRVVRPFLAPPDPGVKLRRNLLANVADRVAAGETTAFASPAMLPAHLRRLTAGVPPSRAAADLAALARRLLDAGEIDAAEAVLIELADTFPMQPAAHAVLPELLRLWAGSERSSLRLAPLGARTTTTDRRISVEGGVVKQASAAVEAAPLDIGAGPGGARAALRRARLRRAVRLGELLERTAPRQFATRGVQRSLAAARRQLGLDTPAGSPAFAVLADDGADALLICKRSTARPRLDGVLSDACWAGAEAVRLADPAGPAAGGLVTLAWDADWLFLAAALPDDPRSPPVEVKMSGRAHDEPVAPFDRLEIEIDVDRDFGTAWGFAVAADGAVAEACCGDASWDPECFVNVSRSAGLGPHDPAGWRIEMAIPLAALTPNPAGISFPWAIRLRRVVPGVGAAVWPAPAADAVAVTDDAAAFGETDRPFGRLRWDR